MRVLVGVDQRKRTRLKLALALGVPIVLVLGASQALLPRLAEQRVRDLLAPYGHLQHVSVSAFPAVELLWGKADRASASAKQLALSEQQAMKLAWEGRGVNESDLHVSALTLRVPGLPGGVLLRDVTMRKRAGRLSTEGTLRQSDLNAASPAGFRLQLLPSSPGTVKVLASGSLFGVSASVEALAAPTEGRLVAQPLNIPFGQFVQLTLFSDPHVYLDSVSIVPLGKGVQGSWKVALSAHLR